MLENVGLVYRWRSLHLLPLDQTQVGQTTPPIPQIANISAKMLLLEP